MDIMLYQITKYINEYMLGYETVEEFWGDISADSVEEFLSTFIVPAKFSFPKTGHYDYLLFKELEEHIIYTDDNQEYSPLLDSLDVKVATGIVLFKIYSDALLNR